MSPWHALVVEGPAHAARGFVAGFVAAGGGKGGAIFGSDVDLEEQHESLGARLRALFRAGTHEVLLVPAELAAPLADGLRANGEDAGLRLAGSHVVVRASVGFRVEVFSRELAQEIRQDLLTVLPEGVRLEGLAEKEEIEPDARGPELYAPLHAYTFRASGRFAGTLPGVLEMHRRAQTREFVTVGQVHLEEADDPA